MSPLRLMTPANWFRISIPSRHATCLGTLELRSHEPNNCSNCIYLFTYLFTRLYAQSLPLLSEFIYTPSCEVYEAKDLCMGFKRTLIGIYKRAGDTNKQPSRPPLQVGKHRSQEAQESSTFYLSVCTTFIKSLIYDDFKNCFKCLKI